MENQDLEISRGEILEDIIVFTPSVNIDNRGTLFTTYEKDIYDKYLPKDIHFIHDKFAESTHNVLRGLHGDNKTWKLITCIYGDIMEVVADMREDSKNFYKYEIFELNKHPQICQ